jgi:hypothetical protein
MIIICNAITHDPLRQLITGADVIGCMNIKTTEWLDEFLHVIGG